MSSAENTKLSTVACLKPVIRQQARRSGRGRKTSQTEEEVGRQHQEMDRPGVCQVPEGSGQQRKVEENGYGVICGAPMTPAIKE